MHCSIKHCSQTIPKSTEWPATHTLTHQLGH